MFFPPTFNPPSKGGYESDETGYAADYSSELFENESLEGELREETGPVEVAGISADQDTSQRGLRLGNQVSLQSTTTMNTQGEIPRRLPVPSLVHGVSDGRLVERGTALSGEGSVSSVHIQRQTSVSSFHIQRQASVGSLSDTVASLSTQLSDARAEATHNEVLYHQANYKAKQLEAVNQQQRETIEEQGKEIAELKRQLQLLTHRGSSASRSSQDLRTHSQKKEAEREAKTAKLRERIEKQKSDSNLGDNSSLRSSTIFGSTRKITREAAIRERGAGEEAQSDKDYIDKFDYFVPKKK